MLSLRNLSIRIKLTIIIVGTSILTLILGLSAYLIYDIKSLQDDLKNSALLNATVIGQYLIEPLQLSHKDDATIILENFKVNPNIKDACLYSAFEEAIFAQFHSDTIDQFCFPIIQHEQAIFKDNALHIIYTINSEEKYCGMLYIRLSTQTIRKRLIRNLSVIAILFFSLLLALLFIALYLQKIISKPILNLAKHAANISLNHDYSMQIEPIGKDEVGFLYEQFNNLILQIQKRKKEQDKAEEEIFKLNTSLEKRIEKRTQQLQLANKELDAFAHSVSHDLKAPLRHIAGFVRLLYSNIDNPSENIDDYYKKINDSTNRLTSMINDLLAFSRLGRKEINLSVVDLNVLINNILIFLKPDYENRKIEWNINSLPLVSGDEALLQIAFENLISNAIKYTSKRQSTRIEIGYTEEKEEEVSIFIKDNGVGFNMEYKDRLFGVFQRLHTDKEYEGTGIGLANVKRIILKHKGKIWAEAKTDEGATFFISLKKAKNNNIQH